MLIPSQRERKTLAFSLALSSALVLLSGCGLGTAVGVDSSSVVSPEIKGTIFGGQQPISGAPIGIYIFGSGGYGSAPTLLATSSPTDANGSFRFAAGAYTCPQANAPVYLLATGGNPGLASGTNNTAILLGAAIGTCGNAPNVNVHLNEVTTAAMAYSLAQFFTTTLGAGSTNGFGGPSVTNAGVISYSKGLLAAANNTFNTIVNAQYGYAYGNTPTITFETAKLNSIANALASCVNTSGPTSTSCSNLFTYTTPAGGTAPSNTLQAAVEMALHPFQNVANIYNLPTPTAPFSPSLSSAPHDWTVAVSYANSTFGLGVNAGTTSNLDIDASGNIWFPVTNITGPPVAGVVQFDPSANAFNGPYTQAGLTHPQNIAIDNSGYVWATDYGSSALDAFLTTNPASTQTISLANTTSFALTVGPANEIYTVLSGTTGLGTGNQVATLNAARSSYTASARLTHIPTYIASSGNATGGYAEYMYIVTSDGTSVFEEDYIPGGTVQLDNTFGAFGNAGAVALSSTANGDDVVTAPGGTKLCSYFRGCITNAAAALSGAEGIAVDGSGTIWVADSTTAAVSVSPSAANGYAGAGSGTAIHDAANGSTMVKPYGIGVDNSGNVWVTNAGCTTTGCTPGSFVLSELVGAAAPTITPLAAQTFTTTTTGTRPTR